MNTDDRTATVVRHGTTVKSYGTAGSATPSRRRRFLRGRAIRNKFGPGIIGPAATRRAS
ncbi:hypothetical protein [Streptomyces werraensis]|uniref:hypothetical protein n=1 Tax=Streptomyces werraensis TaxID=68284 RepID=UPI003801E935